jgi:hypothetical protein
LSSFVSVRDVGKTMNAAASFRGELGTAKPTIVIARLDRATQYSRAAGDKSRGRGVLDHPHARVMTI